MPYIIWRFPVYSRRAASPAHTKKTYRDARSDAAMWPCWPQPSDRVCLCVYTLTVCVRVRLSEGQDRNSCHLNQPFPFRLVPTERDGFKSWTRKTKTGSKRRIWQKNCRADKYIAITLFINHRCFSPSNTPTPCVNKPMTPYSLTSCLQVIIQSKK